MRLLGGNNITLAERVIELEQQHDGLRPAARMLQIDPAYLLRLKRGEKTQPSERVLRRMGLKREVIYVRSV